MSSLADLICGLVVQDHDELSRKMQRDKFRVPNVNWEPQIDILKKVGALARQRILARLTTHSHYHVMHQVKEGELSPVDAAGKLAKWVASIAYRSASPRPSDTYALLCTREQESAHHHPFEPERSRQATSEGASIGVSEHGPELKDIALTLEATAQAYWAVHGDLETRLRFPSVHHE